MTAGDVTGFQNVNRRIPCVPSNTKAATLSSRTATTQLYGVQFARFNRQGYSGLGYENDFMNRMDVHGTGKNTRGAFAGEPLSPSSNKDYNPGPDENNFRECGFFPHPDDHPHDPARADPLHRQMGPLFVSRRISNFHDGSMRENDESFGPSRPFATPRDLPFIMRPPEPRYNRPYDGIPQQSPYDDLYREGVKREMSPQDRPYGRRHMPFRDEGDMRSSTTQRRVRRREMAAQNEPYSREDIRIQDEPYSMTNRRRRINNEEPVGFFRNDKRHQEPYFAGEGRYKSFQVEPAFFENDWDYMDGPRERQYAPPPRNMHVDRGAPPRDPREDYSFQKPPTRKNYVERGAVQDPSARSTSTTARSATGYYSNREKKYPVSESQYARRSREHYNNGVERELNDKDGYGFTRDTREQRTAPSSSESASRGSTRSFEINLNDEPRTRRGAVSEMVDTEPERATQYQRQSSSARYQSKQQASRYGYSKDADNNLDDYPEPVHLYAPPEPFIPGPRDLDLDLDDEADLYDEDLFDEPVYPPHRRRSRPIGLPEHPRDRAVTAVIEEEPPPRPLTMKEKAELLKKRREEQYEATKRKLLVDATRLLNIDPRVTAALGTNIHVLTNETMTETSKEPNLWVTGGNRDDSQPVADGTRTTHNFYVKGSKTRGLVTLVTVHYTNIAGIVELKMEGAGTRVNVNLKGKPVNDNGNKKQEPAFHRPSLERPGGSSQDNFSGVVIEGPKASEMPITKADFDGNFYDTENSPKIISPTKTKEPIISVESHEPPTSVSLKDLNPQFNRPSLQRTGGDSQLTGVVIAGEGDE